MKNILIVLLCCLYGGMLNAFEYHFPNNGMKIYKTQVKYDIKEGKILPLDYNCPACVEKILEITFETKNMGYKPIKKLLEELLELDEVPRDYFIFNEILNRHTSTSPSFLYNDTEINYEIYFPGGAVKYEGQELRIVEDNFRRAVKKLKVNEEKTFLKIEFITYRNHFWEKEIKDLNVNIRINREIIPSTIIMKCKRIDKQIANCWFVNEKDEVVTELVEQWNSYYPQDLPKEIKQEIQKTKKQQAKRKGMLEKECPNLYRTLYNAQQGYYVDPILGLKAAERFEEIGCAEWLQE